MYRWCWYCWAILSGGWFSELRLIFQFGCRALTFALAIGFLVVYAVLLSCSDSLHLLYICFYPCFLWRLYSCTTSWLTQMWMWYSLDALYCVFVADFLCGNFMIISKLYTYQRRSRLLFYSLIHDDHNLARAFDHENWQPKLHPALNHKLSEKCQKCTNFLFE